MNRRMINKKIVKTAGKKGIKVEDMAKKNDEFLRSFKKSSPCIREGGCLKQVQAKKCTKETLTECYKTLSRSREGSRQLPVVSAGEESGLTSLPFYLREGRMNSKYCVCLITKNPKKHTLHEGCYQILDTITFQNPDKDATAKDERNSGKDYERYHSENFTNCK